ncbi:hypothetical protein [Brevibacillus formosus]|uniref:hypothetical protein n=1 Tax=Brevibacillus formosus TaxID=54913 RepID=UPI003F1C9140
MKFDKELLVFLPLFIAIVGAVIAYFFGQRSKNLERFYDQTKTSLKEITSPIFHELRNINATQIPEKKERLLRNFFEKYSSKDTNIYLIGNRFILEYYYKLHNFFNAFLITRNEKDWEEFCQRYDGFFITIEEEYWKTFEISYSEYKWNQFNMNKNIFFRLWNGTVRFLHITSKVIVVVAGFCVYFAIYDQLVIAFFKDMNILPDDFFIFSIMLLFLSLILYSFMTMVNSYQLGYTQKGKGLFYKILKKACPNAMRKWDKLWDRLISLPRGKKGNKKTPPMYQKKDIEVL